MSNPLTDVVPPAVRRVIYLVCAAVGLALGGVQVALASLGHDQPAWLVASLSVFAFVGTALGATAASNTRVTPTDPAKVTAVATAGASS